MYGDIVERELFLTLVADGIPPMLAGFEVQWTPRQTRLNLADPDFAVLIREAQTRNIDAIEHQLMVQAKKGNMAAIQLVLFNKRGDDWKDIKRVEVRGHVTHSVVDIEGAKQAALEYLSQGRVAELQPGGIMDAESSEDDDVELG